MKSFVFSNDILFHNALRMLLNDVPATSLGLVVFFDLIALPDIRDIDISNTRCAVFFSDLPLMRMLDRYFSFSFPVYVINRRISPHLFLREVNQLMKTHHQHKGLPVVEKRKATDYHREIIRGIFFSPQGGGADKRSINHKQLSAHKQKLLKTLDIRSLADLYVPMSNLYMLEIVL